MKNQFSYIIVFWIFISCNSEVNKQEINKQASVKKTENPALDTINIGMQNNFDSVLIALNNYKSYVMKYNPNVSYSSSIKGKNSIQECKLNDSVTIRSLYNGSLSERKMDLKGEVIYKKSLFENLDNQFNYNALTIDYTDSYYYLFKYLFKKSKELMLIISHPMQFTGSMTSYSFYQVINLKNKIAYEFICFGESPEIIGELDTDLNCEISYINGDYSSLNDIWSLFISKYNTNNSKEKLPLKVKDKSGYVVKLEW